MHSARTGAMVAFSALTCLACTVREATFDPSFQPQGGASGTAGGAQAGAGQGGAGGAGDCGESCAHTLWAKTFAATGDQIATGVAVDADDNVAVVGWFSGDFRFGDDDLQLAGSASQALVAKIAPGGEIAWVRQSSGDGQVGHHKATAVAIDSNDNIIVAGVFANQLGFPSAACQAPVSAGGLRDGFVAKLNPAGECQWLRVFEGQAVSTADIGAVAVDAADDIWVVGSFTGSVNLGAGSVSAAGTGDAFAIKLDAQGAYTLHRTFGNPATQVGRAVATDPSDRVFVGASNGGTITVDGNGYSATGTNDVFLVGLASDATAIGPAWVHNVYADAVAPVGGLATDSVGAVLLTGTYRGNNTRFFSEPLPDSGAVEGAYVVKIGPSGVVDLALGYGAAPSKQIGVDIATDGDDNILALGAFHGSIALGGGPALTTRSMPVTATDVFVAKLGPDGTPIWSRDFGDQGANEPMDIAADSTGDVYIAGSYAGAIQFGGQPAPTSPDGLDFFLVKLAH